MEYYEIITSDKSNDKTDLYLMIKDENINEYVFNCGTELDINKPIRLIATNLVPHFRELDFPSVGSPEIVSGEFKKLTEDLGDTHIKFYPAYVENVKVQKEYFVMQFTNLIECIDYNRSKYTDFPIDSQPGKTWRSYIMAVIRADIEIKHNIFKSVEDSNFLFVNDMFRKAFKKRKLIGCDFHRRG